MQHLQSNSTLQGGKYIIERVLGQGGFGITYLAHQPSLKREVAIKEFFMKDYCTRDDDSRTMTAPSLNRGGFVEKYRKKFIKEARNLARLKHPHIISVIDVFEENDTVYYVMPYLSKGSLQDYVEKHGALSEQEAMKYVKQIAQALKYMHEEQHICHYDVKPANILVDDKDNAVLIDFGISKNYDAQGQETTTTPVGVSEGYAPIEQYQQNVEEFSPASDVYALGATLYFLLHGKRPASAIHRASGTTLLINTQLSQGIKDIITTSMKVSKRDRAQSIDIFIGTIKRPKIEGSRNLTIRWIIGIVVATVVGFIVYSNSGVSDNSNNIESYSNKVEEPSSTLQSQEDINDIYKKRAEQFARNQSDVIISYPNDKRHCVYFSKPTTYGHKELFRYDARTEKIEKIELPIQATIGYTTSWVTKNKRFIFVAAEERYTDFIRIDTQNKQIKYITDCYSVDRTSSGFTVTKTRCINEDTAQSSAEMEYAYTDYYYDEEGNCLGHRDEYR